MSALQPFHQTIPLLNRILDFACSGNLHEVFWFSNVCEIWRSTFVYYAGVLWRRVALVLQQQLSLDANSTKHSTLNSDTDAAYGALAAAISASPQLACSRPCRFRNTRDMLVSMAVEARMTWVFSALFAESQGGLDVNTFRILVDGPRVCLTVLQIACNAALLSSVQNQRANEYLQEAMVGVVASSRLCSNKHVTEVRDLYDWDKLLARRLEFIDFLLVDAEADPFLVVGNTNRALGSLHIPLAEAEADPFLVVGNTNRALGSLHIPLAEAIIADDVPLIEKLLTNNNKYGAVSAASFQRPNPDAPFCDGDQPTFASSPLELAVAAGKRRATKCLLVRLGGGSNAHEFLLAKLKLEKSNERRFVEMMLSEMREEAAAKAKKLQEQLNK